MNRLAPALLAVLLMFGLAFVAITAGMLPPRVATHFAAGGAANGWMPRGGYVAFAVLFQLLLPLGLYFGVGWMPVRYDRFTNLPHRDYWLAPERRAETAAWLRGLGAAVGCAAALLAIGLHAAILDANTHQPPRLHEPTFIAGMVVFVGAVLAAVIVMHRKFHRVPRRR